MNCCWCFSKSSLLSCHFLVKCIANARNSTRAPVRCWRALIKFYCFSFFFEQHKSNSVPVHNHEKKTVVKKRNENLVYLWMKWNEEKKQNHFSRCKTLNIHLLKKSDASVDIYRNTTANFTIFSYFILQLKCHFQIFRSNTFNSLEMFFIIFKTHVMVLQ